MPVPPDAVRTELQKILASTQLADAPGFRFDYPSGAVRIYGDGSRPLSWVSYQDVARIAIAALAQPAARNATLDVDGPEALSPLEVCRVFEAAGAPEIEVTRVPEVDLRAQWEAATDPMQSPSPADAAVCARRRDGSDPRAGAVPRAAHVGA